jgi:hypothetical protein
MSRYIHYRCHEVFLLFSTRLYEKGDNFNFDIINFPHLDSNIPTASAYGVYISRSSLQFVCSMYNIIFNKEIG